MRRRPNGVYVGHRAQNDSYLLKEKIMNQLVRYDTNALNRALLGFDNLFDNFEHRFANQINQNYPPYNILKHDDDSYELEIAVTGFEKSEITVEIDQNQLVVKGQRKDAEDVDTTYLHRGLATRDFTRSWTLAEHMEVGEGTIKNGVLTIELKRVVPEALKPRVLKLKAE
jgi:molecular chaperone IbpA